MKFDKSKILTCVTADQAKVGQKGWFAVLPQYIQEKMSGGQEPSVLSNIDLDSQSPFTREGENPWPLFYPAPEPTYAERQAEWVKQNGVKEGTKVRVTRTFTEDEDGSYCGEHDDLVGMIGSVDGYGIVPHRLGNTMSDGYSRTIPYFALEVIKKPTYRPYNNDELNDLVGEVLTCKKSGRRKLVTGKPTEGSGVNLDGSYINAKNLLSSFYRNTNEPCGIKE